MALPKGWGETANEWRVRVLDPKRFLRLRPKQLEGIRGVYMVGGPIKGQGTAYVVQGLRFKKADWPSLTAAVGWFEASKFGGMIDNPPRRVSDGFTVGDRVGIHPATDAWMQGDRFGEVVGFTRGKRNNMGGISRLIRVKLDSGRVRNFSASNLTEVVERDRTENPPRGSMGLHVIQFPSGRWGFVGSVPLALAYEGDPEEIEKARRFGPGFARVKTLSWPTKAEAIAAAQAIGAETIENPPRGTIAGKVGLYVHRIREACDLYLEALKAQHDQTQAGRKPSLKLAIQLEGIQETIYQLAQAMGPEGALVESRRENPPEPDPSARIKWHEAPRPLGDLARTRVHYEGGRFLEGAVLDLSQEERDRISDYLVRLRHPLAFEPGTQVHRIMAAARELASSPGGEVTSGEGRYWTGRRKNPPKRVQAFSAAARGAIDRLVDVEVRLSAAIAQALRAGARGAVPKALREKVRRLQLEHRSVTESVKVAVARHGAALGEFSVPEPRRENPSDREAAIERFVEFHGTRPENFTVRKIPDLSKLVTLGRALEVHYQAHVPRGERNTPYRHAFGPGATLLTDATGKALVILGNISVGRAPKGRLGYIRG